MVGFMPQGAELIIVILLVVLLFGGAQLPKLARSLGEAKRELKAGMNEDDAESTTTEETESKK